MGRMRQAGELHILAQVTQLKTSLNPVSNMAMTTHHTDQRLDALEIKASYADDLLEKLDQVIVRQQVQIDLLILEIHRLRQPMADVDGLLQAGAGSDRPPHY